MNAAEAQPWQRFLRPAAGADPVALRMRQLSRWGHPLLLLPRHSRSAQTALELYPAQSTKARLTRAVLARVMGWGISPGLAPVDLSVGRHDPFIQFLSGDRPVDECNLGILLGNPNAAGRRFIVLVMDQDGNPLHVVKVGAEPAARTLIQREIAFLKSFSPQRLQSPALLGEFSTDDLGALKLGHAAGHTPSSSSSATVVTVLRGWLNDTQPVPFASLKPAQRLMESPHMTAAERVVLERLGTAAVRTTIYHGDFAPWNVREQSHRGDWVVLDWERGEPQGPPAWDWFHFVLQPAVLVAKLPARKALDRIDQITRTPEFLAYAEAAGVGKQLDELLLAYVLTCRDVLRQTEGGATIQELARLLMERTTR
jgi:hypothetical protein